MKPFSAQLGDLLAQRYVMGSMRGAARDRFEQLSVEQEALRAQIRFWQQRLTPLVDLLPEVQPPPSVWQGIERRLFGTTVASVRLWRLRWPAFGAGFLTATLAAWLLVMMIPHGSAPVAQPEWHLASLLTDEDSHQTWLVEFYGGSLYVQANHDLTEVAGHAFELWVLPKAGKPRSLGVIANGGKRVTPLDDALIQALRQGAGLAVSLEPAGGSPTGQPTGKIVSQGKLFIS